MDPGAHSVWGVRAHPSVGFKSAEIREARAEFKNVVCWAAIEESEQRLKPAQTESESSVLNTK